MYKIRRYFQGVIKQAKMVRWPKRVELLHAFAVVMVILVISAAALSLDDFVIANLLNALDEQLGTASSEAASVAMRFILMFLK